MSVVREKERKRDTQRGTETETEKTREGQGGKKTLGFMAEM